MQVASPMMSGGVVSGGGLDPNADAFLTAAGIVDNTQRNALNNLVLSFKSTGVWDSLLAFYPFLGGTAESHKWNLKNPSDTDFVFRLSFGGTLTHDANGVKGDGTSGFADTFFNCYTDGGANTNLSLGVYVNEPITFGTSRVWIGTTTSTFTQTVVLGVLTSGSYIAGVVGQDLGGDNNAGRVTTPLGGQFTLNAGASRLNTLYGASGTNVGSTFTASGATINTNLNLFRFATPTNKVFSNNRFASAHIGLSMTPQQVLDYTNAVNAYQTALGRNF
jgi:hypothetical protein